MRILVTGGGGFLGTHIIQKLLENNQYMVTNFSRHEYEHLNALGVPTIRGDLTKKEDLERLFTHEFDAIFHVAALAGVWGKRSDYEQINTIATQTLLDFAKSHQVKRFIYTSTPSVVFGDEDIIGGDETLPYAKKFLTHYAETKRLAEEFVLQANSETFQTCAIRPHLIWGPGDPHIVPRLLSAARSGKLRIVGTGENLVDVTYVENAAMAHVQAFEALGKDSVVAGQAYFIGQERPVNLWDFINTILERSGVPRLEDTISESKAYAVGAVLESVYRFFGITSPEPAMTRFVARNLSRSHYFSHKKAETHFGHYPSISIEEGLLRTFAQREANRAKVSALKSPT